MEKGRQKNENWKNPQKMLPVGGAPSPAKGVFQNPYRMRRMMADG
jgi:hypothetical protein